MRAAVHSYIADLQVFALQEQVIGLLESPARKPQLPGPAGAWLVFSSWRAGSAKLALSPVPKECSGVGSEGAAAPESRPPRLGPSSGFLSGGLYSMDHWGPYALVQGSLDTSPPPSHTHSHPLKAWCLAAH